ncbi:hypothetical protein [Marivita geojedonensis]|uniref:hypothetical protein n=1 Tax=Marivita geojedonensis TaxID=1123756 RepID=UPI000A1D7D19|nr:hypothetical protein [Marivita geojedonensis]PRY77838.1 hypothetical protein CLV76_10724 [Marivita geojedonensis]
MNRFAAILIAGSLLAGCASDPLRDVPRLSDADVSESEIQAAIRETPEAEAVEPTSVAPQKRGLFGRLFGGAQASDPSPVPDVGVSDAGSDADAVTEDAVAETAAADATQPQTPRRGLLGFLSRAAADAQTQPEADGVQVAALAPETRSDAGSTAAPGGARVANGPKPGAPDYQIVQMGTVLPYGTLARVCDVPTRKLGTRVERYPERGSGYAIYDSQPGNTAPHTFYVTGFDDGCARQFTAALAMFGSPETHEQLRYGLPSKVQPYSSTDAAYETLKSRVCRVGKGKPCGSAMSRLARDTVFVSVYERFGSNPVWKTILLHGGEVIETDIRGN